MYFLWKLRLGLLLISFAILQVECSSLKFSELIETLDAEIQEAVVKHPLYHQIAKGSLDLNHFKVLVQQDDQYVQNYIPSFSEMAANEADPGRKAYLDELGNQSLEDWDKIWRFYYDKFNFTATKKLNPATHAYNSFHTSNSKQRDVSVALAGALPCYTIWAKLGIQMLIIQNSTKDPSRPFENPYQKFIDDNSPSEYMTDARNKLLQFIDGYYDRLDGDEKGQEAMVQAFRQGVKHEYAFASASYVGFPEPDSFSQLVLMEHSDKLKNVTDHKFYQEIGNGTLPLDAYKAFIQQDHLYIKYFYGAYAVMANKETDPELKKLLIKNPNDLEPFFQKNYELYNFSSDPLMMAKTEEYAKFMLDRAITGSSIGEGLASLFACYTVWDRMGATIHRIHKDIGSNDEHPYAFFLDKQKWHGPKNKSLKNMSKLIDAYFYQLSHDPSAQRKMSEAYKTGLQHEYNFVEQVYSNDI